MIDALQTLVRTEETYTRFSNILLCFSLTAKWDKIRLVSPLIIKIKIKLTKDDTSCAK